MSDDSEDDAEEKKDVVHEVSGTMFDQTLDDLKYGKKGGNADKIRGALGGHTGVESSVNKVSAILTRNSQVARFDRNSVVGMTSNKKDFDYLFLTKVNNEKYYNTVRKELEEWGEAGFTTVFSEIIQSFTPDLEVSQFIILITPKSLFLLDVKSAKIIKKEKKPAKYELRKLNSIIMISTNPCIFSLSFTGGTGPLLLQSVRRSELVMFLLQHCRQNDPTVKVTRTAGIRIFTRNKSGQQEWKTITFEKVAIKENNKLSKALMEQIEKNVQLNNFANAIESGYLEMKI